MDKSIQDFGTKFVPQNYLKLALDSRNVQEKKFRLVLEKKKVPEIGWKDHEIEEFIQYLSSLDSNNFHKTCGVGEREARIACKLVARRHYNFGHGIGRSGDLLEPQPKAAGSTLLSNLTNSLILDYIQTIAGIRSTKSCFLVPLATGMTLTLCFLTLKKQKPLAKFILWSRIDQKACFKSITTHGSVPVIIEPILDANNQGLHTNIEEFENQIKTLGSENILSIFSTTSCFAPRNCDDIIKLAQLAKKYDIAHVVNNAYGLQSSYLTHQIEQANRENGRIDLFIQSTDKNFMVPVGGAIVAGFNEDVIKSVAKSYVGRASSSQTLDILMTMLSVGTLGFKELLDERKQTFLYLTERLKKLADNHEEIVLQNKNPISVAFTLKSLGNDKATELGSMLFTRGVSGARVITGNENKTIDSYSFKKWGSHTEKSIGLDPYLTAAAALGVNKLEVDNFIEKLDKCLTKSKS